MSETTRIADALVLCMTRGMSLTAWESSGVLKREWAIYERLKSHYGSIIVVSYGVVEDEPIATALGATVVCNRAGDAPEAYAAALPQMVVSAVRAAKAESVLVKTNQFEGGTEAVAITRALRAIGVHTALIARAGYPWSRFEAWKHDPTSVAALRAASEEGDLCRTADLVQITTFGACDELRWRYHLAEDRVAVVPNYVVDGAFDLTREARTPSHRAVILSVGRLDAQKQFEVLIGAFSPVGALKDEPVTVRIIGEGPRRSALAAFAKAHGVPLELPGQLDHESLLRELATCTVYVQCSAFEGHPKTLIEAMATGAPVVVVDAPGLGDTVTHEINGLRTDRFGHRLDEQIKRLLEDAPLRTRIGKLASQWARSNFALGVVADKEIDAHRAAFHNAKNPASARPTIGPVRWDPALLHAPWQHQTDAWRTSINGFARRLAPRERSAFLLSLDDPIYQLQGPAAIEVEQVSGGSGIHPKHRLMRYHDFFVERIKPGERVIDLGSGVGALAASIASRCNAGVTGLELEPANIAKANAIAAQQSIAGRVKYTLGDITTHRAEGVFDVVVLSNVLEHIKNRPAMLRQWAQWYSPSRFLIRVPAFDRDWKVPFKKELGVEWRLDDTHELEYTAETLESELREAGLEITETIVRWGEYWVSARPSPSREVWASIRMLVFDFDGVMSNNQVLVMQDGTEGVLCNRSDGLGIEMLRKAAAARDAAAGAGQPPFSMLVLSKEVNPVVAARCKKLKLECRQGVDDKLPHLQRLAADRGVTRGQVAYVGNDVNDVACMQWAGLPIAVNDAFPACKAAARVVTAAAGGHGAVREVCERIVAAWDS
jgi:YrbI family 3-deoxy-D-manno-octulosonate 8-phosphate phosphatase